MTTFGLSPNTYQTLLQLFEELPEIEKVLIFGSRALGTHHDGSDIDLAIKGKNVTMDTIISLNHLIEESDIMYKVDLINYNNIDTPKLKKHIDTKGISF